MMSIIQEAMKKKIAWLLVMGLLVSLTACGGATGTGSTSSRSTGTAENADAKVIKISHQNAASHPIQQGLLEFKKLLEEKSDGAITCDIYDSAVLGNDISNIQQVIAGQLDAAMIMGVCLWAGYDERANFEELPFLFDNAEEAWAAYDGEMGAWAAENIIEPYGGKVVGYWENGMRHFTNNSREITTPADMAGLKFRCPQVTIHLDMYDVLNSSAITMAFSELYTALQQGTVDGQDNPLGNIVASSLYEVQPYISLSGHMYNTSVFFFSDGFWGSLSAEEQQLISECSQEAANFTRQLNIEYEKDYLQTMRDYGCEIVEVDRDAFKTAIAPLWQTYVDKFGNEFISAAKPYISDQNSLAHQFG